MNQIRSLLTGKFGGNSSKLRFTTCFLSIFLIAATASASAAEESARHLYSEKQTKSVKRSVQKGEARAVTNNPKSIVERLKPGDELQSALRRIASNHKLKAGVIVSAVGSLSTASLRFASANEATTIEGPLEVVSVTGTISDASMHVHLSVSDSAGKTVGGHLMSGCKVFTTIELVILDLSDEWTFERRVDQTTTYLELDPKRAIDK